MLSPSLLGAERAAYELKFDLTAECQPKVLDWAKQAMRADVHGDATGRYQVSTLYFDTPTRSVFHREPGFKTTKYRLRRYGVEDLAFFERKSKRGSRVRKIREAGPNVPDWFEAARETRGLEPVLWVSYDRHAYMADGGARLTMDSDLRAWTEDDPTTYARPGPLVMELKFHDTLPRIFRELVAELRLIPTSRSKYRWAMTQIGGRTEDACPTS